MGAMNGDELERLLAKSRRNVMRREFHLPKPASEPRDPRVRRLRRRFTVLTAIMAGVALVGFGAPTVLQIGRFFNLLKNPEFSTPGMRAAVLAGYGEAVHRSVTSNGITLTIGNVYADPLRFVFDVVESFTPQAPARPVIEDGDFRLRLNGKETLNGFSGGQFVPASGGRYAGVVYMPMMNMRPFRLLPDHFALHVHVSRIGNVKGNWTFTIPVSFGKMMRATKVFHPDVSRSAAGQTLTVNEVYVEPQQTIIEATWVESRRLAAAHPAGDQPPGSSPQMLVVDGHGRVFGGGIVGSSMAPVAGGGREYHLTIEAGKLPSPPIRFTLTPLVTTPVASAPLTGHLPITFKGPFGPVEVTGLQFLPDQTLVHLRMRTEWYAGQDLTQVVLQYGKPTSTVGIGMRRLIPVNAAGDTFLAVFGTLDSNRHYTVGIYGTKPVARGLSATVSLR